MIIKYYLIACTIPLLSIIFDVIVMHGAKDSFSILQYIRASVMIIIIGVLITSKRNFNIVSKIIFIFLLYMVLLSLVRSILNNELFTSIHFTSKISISMLLFMVGYSYINTVSKIHYLNIFTILTGAFILSYLVFVNVFNIGNNMYFRESLYISDVGIIRTGRLGGTSINIMSYIILLAPFIYYISSNEFKKRYLYLIYFIFALLFLSLFMILRRSAILIVFLGYIIYFTNFTIFWKRLKRTIFKNIFILLILLPLFLPFIFSIYKVRGDYAISTRAFEQDLRSKEIKYIVRETFISKNISDFLFGKSFDTAGAYPFAYHERPLHSDISTLLYVSGVIGFCLYILIHICLFFYGYKLSKYSPKVFFIVLLVLVMSNMAMMYPGRITAITPRSIMYIYMGSILGIMRHNYLTQLSNKKIEKF